MIQRRFRSAVLWSGLGQTTQSVLRYVTLLLFAWALTPRDFGLLGIAMIFILIAEMVGELGLASAIVQRQEREEPALSTAFWANMAISLCVAVISYSLAGDITSLLGDVAATPYLQILSVSFPLMAMGVIPRALLEQELDFRNLTRKDVLGQCAYSLVGAGTLFIHAGVWSLVAAVLAQYTVATLVLWRVVDWRPKLAFSYSTLRDLLGFGIWAMSGDLLTRLLGNIDYIIVGRLLGSAALGYYTFAFQLTIPPVRRLIGMVRRVAFPALSSLHADLEKMRRTALTWLRNMLALVLPLALATIVLAGFGLRIFYGEKWLNAVLPMQMLAFGAIFYGVDLMDSVYMAIGKPEVRILVILFRGVIFTSLALAFGVSFGIAGVSASLAVALLFSFLLALGLISRVLKLPAKQTVGYLTVPIRSGVLAGIPVLVIFWLAPSVLQNWEAVLLAVGSSILYIGLIRSMVEITRGGILGVRLRLVPLSIGNSPTRT